MARKHKPVRPIPQTPPAAPPSANGHSNDTPVTANVDGAFRQMQEVVYNMLTSRASMLSSLIDPRRDVYKSCGLPDGPDGSGKRMTAADYQFLFDRESTAGRVVEVLAKASWQVQPDIFDRPDDKETPFKKSWDELSLTLRGEQSFYKGPDSNPIWREVLAADVLAGIGQYGIIVLGIDDIGPSGSLAQPIEFKPGPTPRHKLIWIQALPESLALVKETDQEVGSPRYGQPTMYSVIFNNQSALSGIITSTMGTTGEQTDVHWSRVIHVCDIHHQASSSKTYGVPRLKPVLNHILALQKLYPGSAEMYWLGAFPGYSIEETKPGSVAPADISKIIEQFKPHIENYMNDLQRFLMLFGLTMKSMAPQVVDPTSQVNVHLEAIAIKTGIPMRKLKGSERGELSSTQDDGDWNDLLRERQINHNSPALVIPLVDRLIQVNVLAQPDEKDGWRYEWPDLGSQTEKEAADIAAVQTNAIHTYTSGNSSSMITPFDYLTRIMGFGEEEAQAVIDAAEQLQEELQAEQMLQQQEQMRMQAEAQAAAQQAAGQQPDQSGQPGKNGSQPLVPGVAAGASTAPEAVAT